MINVLIVDDQPQVRRGLRMRLALESDLRVIGEAGDGQTAVCKALELHPCVVVMDVVMPILDGIAATRMLHEKAPGIAVVVLSLHDDAQTRARSLAAGAAAFVEKRSGVGALIEAIRRCGNMK